MSNESGKGIAKSIADFFASLTQEPAEEAGGMVADRIRFWRIKQALRLKEKLEEFLRQRGITDKREVPLKLTVAILDGATMEEDDELHTLWAKLLANAIDPAFKEEVRVAFADILRSLNAFDARLLNEIYDVASAASDKPITEVVVNIVDIANRIQANRKTTELSRDCLVRQQCVNQAPAMFHPGQVITNQGGEIAWRTPPPQQVGLMDNAVILTRLGAAFVKACR